MATPSFDPALVHTEALAGTTTTVSYTVRAGANRLLGVDIFGRPATITSATYGGVSLTVEASTGSGSGTGRRHAGMAFLVAPAVGTADLVVTVTGTTTSSGIRITQYVDVDQTTPLRDQGGSVYSVTGTSSAGADSSLAVTSDADDLVRDLIVSSTALTIGSGQTLVGYGTQASNQRASTEVATGSSTTMSWTHSSGTYAHCAVAIIGAATTQPDPAEYSGTRGKKSWHVASTLTGEVISTGATVYSSMAPSVETSGTESLNRTRARVAGTIGDLAVRISANATTSASSRNLLEDGASTGASVSITAGTAGWFSSTDTVAVDGTTALSNSLVNGGGGSLTITMASWTFDPDGADTVTWLAAHSSSALQSSASTTTYLRASGSRGARSDESTSLLRVPFACNWSGIEVIKVGNTTTGTVDVTSRINGSDGTQALAWASSGSASAEDTTHTDALVDGDEIDWEIVVGAGTGTWETERWTSRLASSNGEFWMVAGAVPGTGVALNTGTNYVALGGELKVNSTEANAQAVVPFDMAVYRLAVETGDNTGGSPTIATLRVNGADSAATFQLQPGLANSYYADLWNVVDLNAGDLVCVELDNLGATNSIRIRSVSLVGVERAAGTSQVTSDASLDWLVRSTAQADSAQAWVVRSAAQADASLAWSVLSTGQVTSDATLNWLVRSTVQADSAQSWVVRSAVQADASLAWLLLSAGQVVSDASLDWLVRSTVQADSAQSWVVRSAVQADASLAWLMRQSVIADRNLSWVVDALATVIADAPLSWAVRAGVVKDRTLAWAVSTTAIPPVVRLKVTFSKIPTFVTRTAR